MFMGFRLIIKIFLKIFLSSFPIYHSSFFGGFACSGVLHLYKKILKPETMITIFIEIVCKMIDFFTQLF